MPQTITDWKADYTGADTNTPVDGDSPTVGPELREIKAVIRDESLNKFFRSDKVAAHYTGGDPTDTLRVTTADLGAEWPADADILPGETLLVTLNDPDPAEYWAVVKTVTILASEVQLALFTGVLLDGTDGTVSHIRRSIYKVPVHPSHPVDPAYAETLHQVSSLPPIVSVMLAQVKDTATTMKVAFPFKIPTAYNVRIFGTLRTQQGTPPMGAMRIKSITHDELEATVTLHSAPGAGNTVAWLFTVYVE